MNALARSSRGRFFIAVLACVLFTTQLGLTQASATSDQPLQFVGAEDPGAQPGEDNVELRIVGGSATAIGSVPWQVSLSRSDASSNYAGHFCGGSILSEDWIITAAHCVDNKAAGDVRVLAGTALLSSSVLSGRAIAEIVVHPSWNPATVENDLALLRLVSPLTWSSQVQPIALPEAGFVGGTIGTISGWGFTCKVDPDLIYYPSTCSDPNQPYPTQLHSAEVTIQTASSCRSALGTNFRSPGMLCASTPTFSADSCFGDSGGPLAVYTGSGWMLAGLVSWGYSCAWSTPGVYTNAANYVSWIRENSPPQPPLQNLRISGADRYGTAVAISQALFPLPSSAQTVILATGESFPDALSAAPLAKKLGGPLLLTPRNAVAGVTLQEIQRLNPALVLIIGREAAVSAEVEREVQNAGFQVTRLGGSDRYETSDQIARFGWGDTPPARAFLATGNTFADALSSAAIASSNEFPILLVDGLSQSLRNTQADLLRDLHIAEVFVAGGPAAVSQGIVSSLEQLGIATTRFSGIDRFDTSLLLAEAFFPATEKVYLTSGWNFPDGLSGGVLAGSDASPMLLSVSNCVLPGIISFQAGRGVHTRFILGGPAALSDAVLNNVSCR